MAAQSQRRPAQQRADAGGDQNRGRRRGDRRPALRLQRPEGVSTDTEKGRLRERYLAAETKHQVEPDSDDEIDQGDVDDVNVIGVDHPGQAERHRHGEAGDRGELPADPIFSHQGRSICGSPKIPSGRTTSVTNSTPNAMTSMYSDDM